MKIQLKNMTPTLWQRLREALGKPGRTRVTDVSGDEIITALIIAKARKDGVNAEFRP